MVPRHPWHELLRIHIYELLQLKTHYAVFPSRRGIPICFQCFVFGLSAEELLIQLFTTSSETTLFV